jgi:hypothetical protein
VNSLHGTAGYVAIQHVGRGRCPAEVSLSDLICPHALDIGSTAKPELILLREKEALELG